MASVEGEEFARKVKCKELEQRIERQEKKLEMLTEISHTLNTIRYGQRNLEEDIAGIRIALLNLEARIPRVYGRSEDGRRNVRDKKNE